MQADKACGEKVKGAKQLFSKKEDEKLIKLVKFFGRKKDVNWQFVAQQMGNRNVRQCKERFLNYLDNHVNRSEFTPEENKFILEKVQQIGTKWTKISSMMKNRTYVSVKSQYKKLIRRNATLDNVLTIDVNTTNTRKSSPLVDYHSVDSSSSDTHDLSNDFQINDVENKHLVDEVFNTLFDTLEFNDDAFFGLTTI
ncbi:Myb-like DNA-binding domain containing protein [Trichomonas vaginalis G3]|uniref:Myb-like DNA-binding domain containing protein n=1 Tax=Trichomonas vaginalis (strain ATCC PRA-98 / G3) TaxID=412133 RepID=A2F877_TRIV3|nr:RNA polymerase II transcription regulator recruiting protein [Trichomonas vaginalis G3]EAX98897.1 Myb-like DNA-binding domain containing protein [Trichomonas vaginalis G3]KAI5511636.1 RNA polymerase II transcription regulator recruiting protein [Trichomonas vaginalis G3]|eukprot:XP_001311827.1 Myb-like DNA-binding domain containing protein [Trichomonas vaginalis G3]